MGLPSLLQTRRARACRTSFSTRRRALVTDNAPISLVSMDVLDTAAGRQHLYDALVKDGMVMLAPAASELAAAQRDVAACYTATRSFLAGTTASKIPHGAGSGPGQQHGWMEYLEESGSECFEDPLFRSPTHSLFHPSTTIPPRPPAHPLPDRHHRHYRPSFATDAAVLRPTLHLATKTGAPPVLCFRGIALCVLLRGLPLNAPF